MGIIWSWGKLSKPSWGRNGIILRKNDHSLSVLASKWEMIQQCIKTHLKDFS